MIIYETTQQLRDLGTQNGRTKDGLSVEFEVNYQFEYSRNIADLSKMYLEYKGGHVRTFDYYAACVIRDVLSGYTAFEAKTDRDVVAIKMMADVKEELSTKGVTVSDRHTSKRKSLPPPRAPLRPLRPLRWTEVVFASAERGASL